MTSSDVAVVIPCYELGRTLEEAVDSVRRQTLPAQEIVVVDDGSRDPFTRQVIARLEEQRIRVIRSGHHGPAHARNLGVESTSASLLVLLDADDLFENTYLERAVTLLDEHRELSFVCCALQAFGRASYRWKPPPYSIADAVGRGACGHISTVFRREVWNAVGGFDPAFSSGEDIDFWLRALEFGFRGAILDEAFVRYRVRRASRYHRAVVQGHYLEGKELLVEKHLQTIAHQGEDVFATLLDFQRELSGHRRALATEQKVLGAEIALLESEVIEVEEAVREHGGTSFDWGDFASRAAEEGWMQTNTLEAYYLKRFLADVKRNGRHDRMLTIGADDPWPEEGKPAYDVIAVAGALEREQDPRAALRRCRRTLRPGGVLLAAVASTTLGRTTGFGFTEASLRALLSELFPPAAVMVTTRGNLLTCLADTVGLPATSLDEADLARADPWHPTLIVASAALPLKRRSRRLNRYERVTTARGPALADRGVVLLYHRIASLEPDMHQLCTAPDVFASHMAIIAERCTPLPLQDLAERAVARRLPAGAVAVTFDDGYLDNLAVASPILVRLGIPATFFMNGDRTEGERETLSDSVERIFAGGEQLPERLRLETSGVALDLPTSSPEERQAALTYIHGLMLPAGDSERRELVAELAQWSGLELTARPTHRLMTSSEVARLSDLPGQAVGAHGARHLLLTAHDDDVVRRELADNRALLEELVGRPVRSLAFPYGACDLRTTRIAEQLGFAVACSVDPDPVTSDSDPLRLPRFEVRGDVDGFEFRLERWLSGA